MHLSTRLLTAVFVVLSAVNANLLSRDDSGGGTTTISFITKINDLGAGTIVEKDRARVRAMKQASDLHKRDGTSVHMLGGGSYHAMKVGIGQPPSKYTLLLSTGSAITWVGMNPSNPYKQTSTSVSTGKDVSAAYGSGSANFSGKGWNDALVLSSELKVNNQFIAVATETHGFSTVSGIDGMISFGPVGLTKGKVSNTNEIPTVMDNIRSQRKGWGAFGISLNPYDHAGGDITIGGIDHKAITADITWTQRTKTAPSSRYWGINASLSYGGTTILAARAGIVDVGSSLIHMSPSKWYAFERFMARTGATIADNGYPRLNISQFRDYTSELTLHFGGKSFGLIPDGMVWPPERNNEIGGDSNSIYFMVAKLGGPYNPKSTDPQTDPDDGYNFVIGHPFLQRFYSVYDDEHNRIGLAPTYYTYSKIDWTKLNPQL